MKIKLTSYEKKNYLLNNKEDFIILKLIKKLETKPLSAEDKIVIQLIRTQLKNNWRLPLIRYLIKLSNKYK